MTWEEKFYALGGIGNEIALRMREPGDWYVDHRGVEVKEGGMLASHYGNGPSPEAAVIDHWSQLVEHLKPGAYIVIHAMDKEKRRRMHWNGFMWDSLPE